MKHVPHGEATALAAEVRAALVAGRLPLKEPSDYRNISKCPNTGQHKVEISRGEHRYFLGRHATAAQAAAVRDAFTARYEALRGDSLPARPPRKKPRPRMTLPEAKEMLAGLQALGAFTGHGKLGAALAQLHRTRNDFRSMQRLLEEAEYGDPET